MNAKIKDSIEKFKNGEDSKKVKKDSIKKKN
jgi:hypothetical protein